MKVLKFLAIFFAVILLNDIYVGKAVGQIKTDNQTTDKTPLVVQSSRTASDNQIPNDNQTTEKYRIGFQDTIEIQVAKHADLSGVFNINSDGTILLPRMEKSIVAVCKTERELGEAIATIYRASILQNPFVNVRVVDQRSQSFAVIGAVEKPGSFFLNRRVRLLELVAMAGGQKIDKAGAIKIARTGNYNGCNTNYTSENENDLKILTFSSKDVMSAKENPWLEPGDIVSVLEAEEAYVVGNVKKPGKILLKNPVTLTQAIAAAEGLDDTAKTSKIIIQRQDDNSSAKKELAFNLKDIRDKKIPDPQLQGNDIVEVSNDGTKTARKKVIDAFTGGLGNVFLRVPSL